MALSSTEGSYTDFAYTGGMQSATLPKKGLYKLEVWGAGGADGASSGAAGGYSVGYKVFEAGQLLYVCVGGAGGVGYNAQGIGGGYNGGGGGGGAPGYQGGGGGGGATHIANASGTLVDLAATTHIHLIAGGGGGGPTYLSNRPGGAGGGSSGAAASLASAGTQSSAGTGSGYNTSYTAGSFGQGGQGCPTYHDENNMGDSRASGGGGGGGLYGGGGGGGDSWGASGGAGGSGYIGGVPAVTFKNSTYSPSTTQGGGSAAGNSGKARITFVSASELPINYNGTVLQELYFNGVKIESCIYNGTTLFVRKIKNILRRVKACFTFAERGLS